MVFLPARGVDAAGFGVAAGACCRNGIAAAMAVAVGAVQPGWGSPGEVGAAVGGGSDEVGLARLFVGVPGAVAVGVDVGERVVVAVGVAVGVGWVGDGAVRSDVAVVELSRVRVVPAGAHVDPAGRRFGEPGLVPEVADQVGVGHDGAERAIGARTGQAGAAGGEVGDHVRVLVGPREESGAGLDADDAAAGIATVRGGTVGRERVGHAAVGEGAVGGAAAGDGSPERVVGVGLAVLLDGLTERVAGGRHAGTAGRDRGEGAPRCVRVARTRTGQQLVAGIVGERLGTGLGAVARVVVRVGRRTGAAGPRRQAVGEVVRVRVRRRSGEPCRGLRGLVAVQVVPVDDRCDRRAGSGLQRVRGHLVQSVVPEGAAVGARRVSDPGDLGQRIVVVGELGTGGRILHRLQAIGRVVGVRGGTGGIGAGRHRPVGVVGERRGARRAGGSQQEVAVVVGEDVRAPGCGRTDEAPARVVPEDAVGGGRVGAGADLLGEVADQVVAVGHPHPAG